MKYLLVAIAALCVSGCAWFDASKTAQFTSPSIDEPQNVVPASFAPLERPAARVATGRPSAIVPCVTGASIADLCRRDAESHLYVETADVSE